MSFFGTQTISLRPVTLGASGRLGIRAKTGSGTPVTGCRFRELDTTEPTGGNTDVITQMFKATVPPVATALAADETYELDYADAPFAGTYVITRVKKHPDPSLPGVIHHVSIFCRKWVA
jgi:hypothetical protein